VSAIATPSATAYLAGKYLTFRLETEEFGMPILRVREIIGVMPITRVPGAPKAIRGVINLRGKVIPVMDLRERFGFPPKEYGPHTCIIVVQFAGPGGVEMLRGMVVDEVSEVVNLAAEQLEPPPTYGLPVSTETVLGIGKYQERVLVLLDTETLLSRTKFMDEPGRVPAGR
jgi:purine-binding chemotaxis protein CheW